jgi:hypothetical protein
MQIVVWNANEILSDQYLLPEFLSEHGIDMALMYETHLRPTKKRSIPAYTIYRTEGHRPPHEETAIAVRSTIHHNKANLPQHMKSEQ